MGFHPSIRAAWQYLPGLSQPVPCPLAQYEIKRR
jgi:hypothetical protein